MLRGQRNRQKALPALQDITTQMERLISSISHTDSLEALRGIERHYSLVQENQKIRCQQSNKTGEG